MNCNKTKEIWKGINELVSRKKNKNKSINSIKTRGSNGITSRPSEISNIMNRYFAEVGPNLASNIPLTDKTVLDYLDEPVHNTFYFLPIVQKEIQDEINSLSQNKSSGLYSCPVKLLKLGSLQISEPLSVIFNKSIQTGTYPHKLKIAKIIPIHKDGDETDPGNYRPISLLSIFNRIFEKLMYDRLVSFINKYGLLYNSQYGFREKHNAQHAIIDITYRIQKNIDQGLFTCGLFIDLKKAFDTVNHNILLTKLSHFGIRGVIHDWFKSYLSNRKQTVSIDGSISDYEVTSCGVPQGSVLGPLLFLIYINDISKSSSILSFYLFADDTSLICEHKDLKKLEVIVNNELKNISEWLRTNRLSLNVKKTNFVIFRPRQKNLPFLPDICIPDNSNHVQQIEQKDFIKYLGVFIDFNLSWKEHINYIVSKISRSIGIIAKLRHFVPYETLINIYKTLINPYIYYGICSWGNSAKTHLERLLVLQKRVLRLINFSDPKKHAIPFFLQTRSLPINFLYFERTSIMMHDIFNKAAPFNLNNLFELPDNIHSHRTRSVLNNCFFIENVRTELVKRSFLSTGPKIWNSLPLKIKQLSKSQFKTAIRDNLLKILKDSDDYLKLDQIILFMKTIN